MASTVKVHRKQRQRRQHANNITTTTTTTTIAQLPFDANDIIYCNDINADEQQQQQLATTSKAAQQHEQHEQQQQQEQQQTVVLINGEETNICIEEATVISNIDETKTQNGANGGNGGNASSRNSSGDAMSLRETLQQLAMPNVNHAHHAHPTRNHHNRHGRTHSASPHSPQSPMRHRVHENVTGEGSNSGSSGSLQQQQHQQQQRNATTTTGIHGFLERELRHGSPTSSALSVNNRKAQSLSEPTASPAPRSLRSRSSLERSPRKKRSKSESRRRRERKLIAAGEMEVRQANETLMRYLKQCSEMNDASLSGELEIDQNYDERRVMRKTKSQRDKRGHLMNKLVSAGGLTSILKELSDDIVPAEGEEIYNPFTPVVSPTEEDTPAHIDKMYMQTSSGYRQLENSYYRNNSQRSHTHAHQYNHHHHHHHHAHHTHAHGMGLGLGAGNVSGGINVNETSETSARLNGLGNLNDSESRCLLDGDCRR